eukprot:TRINITY_DN116434_c0_g1_i1.p1 TRINITY_DN116434_c0_g1~~TRINITY_DN116434_c0_g1_i1.p1  ORF type:complete len:254 (-),score=26.28 TRINITY_DN116434_c0_g1_i1:115-876(-)
MLGGWSANPDPCGNSRNLFHTALLRNALACDREHRGCAADAPAHPGATGQCSRREVTALLAHNPATTCGPCHADIDVVGSQCPICFEELKMSEKCMCCVGEGGKRHYFHENCLKPWIRRSRKKRKDANCPTCRGALTVESRSLHEFLGREGPSVDEENRSVPHSNTSQVHDMLDGTNQLGLAMPQITPQICNMPDKPNQFFIATAAILVYPCYVITAVPCLSCPAGVGTIGVVAATAVTPVYAVLQVQGPLES